MGIRYSVKVIEMYLMDVAINVSYELIYEVCIIIFQIDNQALFKNIDIK